MKQSLIALPKYCRLNRYWSVNHICTCPYRQALACTLNCSQYIGALGADDRERPSRPWQSKGFIVSASPKFATICYAPAAALAPLCPPFLHPASPYGPRQCLSCAGGTAGAVTVDVSRSPDDDEVVMMHEFLSLMLNVRRARVTLAVQALENARTVSPRRAVITIVDRLALEEFAADRYGTASRLSLSTGRRCGPEDRTHMQC